jgi:hypothetical protein
LCTFPINGVHITLNLPVQETRTTLSAIMCMYILYIYLYEIDLIDFDAAGAGVVIRKRCCFFTLLYSVMMMVMMRKTTSI